MRRMKYRTLGVVCGCVPRSKVTSGKSGGIFERYCHGVVLKISGLVLLCMWRVKAFLILSPRSCLMVWIWGMGECMRIHNIFEKL